MATKVQTKSYMPGSMMDQNNGFCNGMWDLYDDGITYAPEKSQFYDPFFMRQTIGGYLGYEKEQTRQTILKQESIFRDQLQELHRLYRRQRDLMNELTMKEHYNFSMPAEVSKSKQFPGRISSFPQVDLTFGRGSILETKGKCTQRKVIDLELPADVDKDNEEKDYNLADLNEPIQMEEDSFMASQSIGDKLQKQDLAADSNSGIWCLSKISQQDLKGRDGSIVIKEQLSCNFVDGKAKYHENGNGVFSAQSNSLQVESKKVLEHSRKRTLFGVELYERSHTPSFDSSRSSSWDQNTSMLHHNHWIGSTNASMATRVHNNNSRLMTSSRDQVSYPNGGCIHNLHTGVGVLNGMNSKISPSDDLEKFHENHEKKLPAWLMAKSSFSSEQTKAKETMVYQMNLDSLQNHSQQFFKKAEITKGAHDLRVENDDPHGVTKILGVPIIDKPRNSKDVVSTETKDNGRSDCIFYHIDLNMSFEEEDGPSTPLIPDSIVKIATMEIDLEAPATATLESEPEDTPSKSLIDDVSMDNHDELLKVAAEAIMSLSLSEPTPQPHTDTLLWWFADVIASGDDVATDSGNLNEDEESIPEGMDEFEYMTLKLQETKEEEYCYKPMMMSEEEENLSQKRTSRKGHGKRGRPRKDFQRDVLPGIVSLTRREVTEDLHSFEEALTGIGVSWQSSLSKRKAAGKNGRGRPRLVASSQTPSSPPAAATEAAEQAVCREVAFEEKSLSSWGKRTRRLPRQRCQNGGNHQSLALKC